MQREAERGSGACTAGSRRFSIVSRWANLTEGPQQLVPLAQTSAHSPHTGRAFSGVGLATLLESVSAWLSHTLHLSTISQIFQAAHYRGAAQVTVWVTGLWVLAFKSMACVASGTKISTFSASPSRWDRTCHCDCGVVPPIRLDHSIKDRPVVPGSIIVSVSTDSGAGSDPRGWKVTIPEPSPALV